MSKRWVIGGFLTVCAIVIFVYLASLQTDPRRLLTSAEPTLDFLKPDLQELETAKLKLEQDRIALERARLKDRMQHIGFWRDVFIYVAIVLAGAGGGGLMIASYFYGYGYLRQKSLVPQVIGQSTIMIYYRLLKDPRFWQVFMQVMLIEAIRAQYPEKALELSLQLIKNFPKYGSTFYRNQHDLPALLEQNSPDTHVPTFAQLYAQGTFAPGQQLCMGFSQGTPQYRQLEDIKALSVAGWQGSGKTLSVGYLTVCLLLQYPESQGYIIDPHRAHPKSLGALLAPLEATGRVHLVNPLELAEIFGKLTRLLTARLEGKAPSSPLLFIVIDELSKVGKLDEFHDHILPFIERCTEETRKANILFIGSGQKWQARHFGNKADIRQSMPSVLIHKTKPSQAELLLEDTQEKHLVKKLTEPGQALLSTSHDSDPIIVTMPLITTQDIQSIVSQLSLSTHSIDRSIDINSMIDMTPQLTSIDHQSQFRQLTPQSRDIDLWSWLTHSQLTQQDLCKKHGIDPGQFSRYKAKRKLTEPMRQAILSEYRKSDKIITFPREKEA